MKVKVNRININGKSFINGGNSIEFIKSIEDAINSRISLNHSNILLAEDTKFGIVDEFLFDKLKPDKNGIYSNAMIIKKSFNSLKEMVESFKKSSSSFANSVVIAYKPLSDKYHFLFIRKMQISKDTIDKYLLLI